MINEPEPEPPDKYWRRPCSWTSIPNEIQFKAGTYH